MLLLAVSPLLRSQRRVAAATLILHRAVGSLSAPTMTAAAADQQEQANASSSAAAAHPLSARLAAPPAPGPPYTDAAALDAHVERAWAHFRALGSPKWHVAPMVDQSELPFRLLCRAHGATAAYTPMLHARLFAEKEHYRAEHFSSCPADRPLFAQFCANDPDTFVQAAQHVQHAADYIDLNLGCPQRIAKRGAYGAFLMDDLGLVAALVAAGAARLATPVSVKVRLFPALQDTLAYARMLEAAGASLLAVHGRTREQKDLAAHRADWAAIAAVRAAVRIPVLANGDVRTRADAEALMAATGADGVLSADPLLHDPTLFSEAQRDAVASPLQQLELCRQYLELAGRHPAPMRMVKGHVFKLCCGWLSEFTHIRDKLNREAGALGVEGVAQLVAELQQLALATGRQEPQPRVSERKLKAAEREAARQAAIEEQEREAAALADLDAQQQQQQEQPAGEVQQPQQPAGAGEVVQSQQQQQKVATQWQQEAAAAAAALAEAAAGSVREPAPCEERASKRLALAGGGR